MHSGVRSFGGLEAGVFYLGKKLPGPSLWCKDLNYWFSKKTTKRGGSSMRKTAAEGVCFGGFLFVTTESRGGVGFSEG